MFCPFRHNKEVIDVHDVAEKVLRRQSPGDDLMRARNFTLLFHKMI